MSYNATIETTVMKTILSNKYIRATLLVVAGIFVGWLFFSGPSHEHKAAAIPAVDTVKKTIWTCAMHPQIREDKPGKCPICGMELIPLVQGTSAAIDPNAISLSADAVALANVETSVVRKGVATKQLSLYGSVAPDEQLLQTLPSHVSGRIEKLYVNITGVTIKKGQAIAEVYSPELVTAQQELLEAAKMASSYPAALQAAKEKLLRWKLTAGQIDNILKTGTVKTNFTIYASAGGVIVSLRVSEGDYVNVGSPLFDIADLSRVWALFDAYEPDIPWIQKGDVVTFSLQSLPGRQLSGKVDFIDPVVDPTTRVAHVRVNVDNRSGMLKPGMFLNGEISGRLPGNAEEVMVPASAVLWTGRRSVVYVKLPGTEEPSFVMREVVLGADLGGAYVIEKGLSAGEEVVTNGVFSVDAAAQLAGKPSMMEPQGGKTNAMPGMDMPGDAKSDSHSENQPVGNTNEKPAKTAASMDFTMQLNTVFDKYIVLKNAFVQSDVKKVKQAAQNVQQALSKVDMKLLTGDAHAQWMDILGNLNKQLKIMVSSGNIEDQRIAFSNFSDQFYKAIKTFGLMGKTAYHQFCPMAFGNKGAFWLSEKKSIENPYVGDVMLTCGETKEVIK